MSQSRSVLELLGQKLGVERKVISKATELSELLDVRANTTSLSALRLTGSCREVACLDLAAKTFGCTLNKVDVVKLSGMNKKSYTDVVKVITSMLNLEERVTIRELAVQFGCSGAVNLATDTLERYISDQCAGIDFSAPMFACAAIIVACRTLKLKIDVSKLKEQSGVRKATLDRLIIQLNKHVPQKLDKSPQVKSTKRSLLEVVEAQIQDDERNKRQKLEQTADKHQQMTSAVEYEEWKRKILARAAETS